MVMVMVMTVGAAAATARPWPRPPNHPRSANCQLHLRFHQTIGHGATNPPAQPKTQRPTRPHRGAAQNAPEVFSHFMRRPKHASACTAPQSGGGCHGAVPATSGASLPAAHTHTGGTTPNARCQPPGGTPGDARTRGPKGRRETPCRRYSILMTHVSAKYLHV